MINKFEIYVMKLINNLIKFLIIYWELIYSGGHPKIDQNSVFNSRNHTSEYRSKREHFVFLIFIWEFISLVKYFLCKSVVVIWNLLHSICSLVSFNLLCLLSAVNIADCGIWILSLWAIFCGRNFFILFSLTGLILKVFSFTIV